MLVAPFRQSHSKTETDAEFDKRYLDYFNKPTIDGWEVRKVCVILTFFSIFSFTIYFHIFLNVFVLICMFFVCLYVFTLFFVFVLFFTIPILHFNLSFFFFSTSLPPIPPPPPSRASMTCMGMTSCQSLK